MQHRQDADATKRDGQDARATCGASANVHKFLPIPLTLDSRCVPFADTFVVADGRGQRL
jgi:hypothetical protein